MIPGVAGQPIGSQMTALSGAPFTGAVTVWVCGDNGLQVIGAVGGGACVHEGRGYHDYLTDAADNNFFRHIAFTFVGAGAVTRTVQVGLPYSMLRGVAGQTIGCQMTALDGSDFTGAVTVVVTGDNGIEVAGAVAAGACVHKGHGYHGYSTAVADCDFGQIAFTFSGVGALTKTIVIDTLTAAQAAAVAAADAPNAFTVRDLITDVLLELGVIGVADPVDNEVYGVAFRWLLRMYSTFQAMRLFLFTVERTLYTLVPNQQVYTIGSGGEFDGNRPIWIAGSEVSPVDSPDLSLDLVPYQNRAEFYREPLKTLSDQWPRRFLYEPTYPLGTLTFWPIPTTAAIVALATPSPLSTPTSLDTTLVFSPGYQDAWHYNLAKRLWRVFPKKGNVDYASLVKDAREALSVVYRLNDEAPKPARSDAALLGPGSGDYDIQSNSYRG